MSCGRFHGIYVCVGEGIESHQESVFGSVSPCVAVCCSVLQRVAVCCSALQCDAVHESYVALFVENMHVPGGGDGIHGQGVFR